MTYALDTNIISYFLRDEGNVRKNVELEILQGGKPYAIPPMTIYEIQRWLRNEPNEEKLEFARKFDRLLRAGEEKSEMTLDVWVKAADIYIDLQQRKQLFKNPDADIVIASFCLINDYTLVTNNTNHFERIKGLKIVDWF